MSFIKTFTAKFGWHNRPLLDTPWTAEEIIRHEHGIDDAHDGLVALNEALLLSLAASPDLIASGTITRSGTGAATGFAVAWPDGATGPGRPVSPSVES